jgi:hypothetical protein
MYCNATHQVRYKKKMEHKLKEARNEIEDLTAEFQREREQMLETIRGQARFSSRGRHCLSFSFSSSVSVSVSLSLSLVWLDLLRCVTQQQMCGFVCVC